jgi:hypothetical protein
MYDKSAITACNLEISQAAKKSDWFKAPLVHACVATSEPTDFSPIHRLPASRGKCQLFNLHFAGLYVKTAPQPVGVAEAVKASSLGSGSRKGFRGTASTCEKLDAFRHGAFQPGSIR